MTEAEAYETIPDHLVTDNPRNTSTSGPDYEDMEVVTEKTDVRHYENSALEQQTDKSTPYEDLKRNEYENTKSENEKNYARLESNCGK